MMKERYKILIFVVLSVSFLIYSFQLYLFPPHSSGKIDLLAQEGKMIWQQKNCTSCHQLFGLGGHLGPDLTNVTSRRDDAYIGAFLDNGIAQMPDFHLNKHEKEALIAFLKSVNLAGKSDPRTFKLNQDGTITQ